MAMRVKNISEGFVDHNGVFHPIRAAGDYVPKRAGEKVKRGKAKGPAKRSDYSKFMGYGRAKPKPKTKTTAKKVGRKVNGRSYAVRGVAPPRGWEPSQGDVVYVEGAKTKLGKPYTEDGRMYFPLRPSVRGTVAMWSGNIKAVVRLPESTMAMKNPLPVGRYIQAKVKRMANGDVKVLISKPR